MNKKFVTLAERLIAGAALMMAIAPAIAAGVDFNIGFPGVVVQQRPVYIQPQYETDWRERHARALQWRDNPKNHGHVVNAAAHAGKTDRKHQHRKQPGTNKHGH